MNVSTEGQNDLPLTSLGKAPRRVLGVLIEKAFTTPDVYPLTLKALTTGCNQKNNRDPVTNYTEDDCEEALNTLRELGLVASVHTESGRTERFRHYMRRRFPELTEPQIAVLGELLLRGRQQVGELRSRASRMVPIDSLEQLREALQGLLKGKFIQSDGSLERRGAEVDHHWYEQREGRTLAQRADEDSDPVTHSVSGSASVHTGSASAASSNSSRAAAPLDSETQTRLTELEGVCGELRAEVLRLNSALENLRQEFSTFRSELGG